MKLLVLFCLIGFSQAKQRYDGHMLFDVETNNSDDVEELNKLRSNQALDLDFWTEPRIGGKVKIHVKPDVIDAFLEALDNIDITPEIVDTDIQKHLDKEDEENELSQPLWGKSLSPIGKFATYEEIMVYLDQISKNNKHVELLTSLGKSYEGRDIPLVKISSGNAKKSVFIDGGIHAREWLSQATVMYVLDKLVKGYNSNSAITEAITKYDWYITPVLNPDGYVYTHTNDRFWRKTRTQYSKRCPGADPNRNFNYPEFGGQMTSNNPCEQIYHGPFAFSEPCIANFRDFFLSNKMHMYFSFHAYSQLLFVPWAYTTKRPADADELDRVAYIGKKAIQNVNGIEFTVGTPGQILYPAGSSSIDWVKGTAGVKYAYGAELRPGMDAFMGFVVDKEVIPLSGEEILAGLLAMTKAAKV